MKKSEILSALSKVKVEANSAHALRVGDVVTHNKADHLVWLVNDSRASLVALGDFNSDPENISPESELPLVKRLGIAGAVALLESKISTPRTPKAPSSDEPRLGKLGGYLGHTVVSVIRTLGKAGWEFKAARSAFDRLSIPAADQTLRIQLKAGRDGNGALADLSEAELATFAAPIEAPKAAEPTPEAAPAKAPKAPRKSKAAKVAAVVAAE